MQRKWNSLGILVPEWLGEGGIKANGGEGGGPLTVQGAYASPVLSYSKKGEDVETQVIFCLLSPGL